MSSQLAAFITKHFQLTARNEISNNVLPIDESFSPLLHRIESAVRYRAVHPEDPILDPPEILNKFAHPNEQLVKKTMPFLEDLVSKADVKKGDSTLINP